MSCGLLSGEFFMDKEALVYRFGEFELREGEHLLLRAGAETHLQPRAFRFLLYLVQNRDRVVVKDEILRIVWEDAVVTENSLARAISALRRVLDDDAREARIIKTVTTVGYQFICPVEVGARCEPRTAEVNSAQPAAEVRPEIELRAVQPGALPSWSRRRWVIALIVIAAGALAVPSLWRAESRARWAWHTALPEIARLEEQGDYPAAAALIVSARSVLGNDPTLERQWVRATGEVSITTDPPGAQVAIELYPVEGDAWRSLGSTPLLKVRVPRRSYLWRISKPGFATETFIGQPPGTRLVGGFWNFEMNLKLWPESSVPSDMVPVGGDLVGLNYPLEKAPAVKLDDFLIDRHEVTNEEFRRFVNAGGYERAEFWTQPFILGGRILPWREGVERFRDSTGRPGPSTWEGGSYPSGQGNYPVAGVSWFEAAAYAAFAGRSLPTGYHWALAAQSDESTPLIAAGGNFHGAAAQPVGSSRATSGWGTTDMAGNVKEWCSNDTPDGRRLIMGGGFGEPEYMFAFPDIQSPWERRANFGFRLVKLRAAANPASLGQVQSLARDYWHAKPVSDGIFAGYSQFYAYDRTDLNPRVEEVVDLPGWRRERVTFNAAYGGERMAVYLFLPRSVKSPLQTVIYFPGAMSTLEDHLNLDQVEEANDFILNSGRALVIPIYKGMYERKDGFIPGGNPPAVFRDHAIAWSKDLGRTIDYLETRREIDSTKLAYLGFSLGGAQAPVLLAMERRIRAAVLLSAGLQLKSYLPVVDPINFVGRVKTPVLVLNGRYDSDFPVDSSQQPLFQFLGTAPQDKKLVVFEGGHGVFPRPEAVGDVLDWFDKYLGPVPK
jgi:eukaryotic-like serine/threonine-protein kinase